MPMGNIHDIICTSYSSLIAVHQSINYKINIYS